MDLTEVFRRLGLPKHSAEIYQILEKKGALSVSALDRESPAHRPALYRSLSALSKAGLVSREQRGKRSVYFAKDRSHLRALFARTQKEVGMLVTERRQSDLPGAIRYFEGESGIAAVFDDVIMHCKRGETFYRYTAERDLDEVNKYLPPDYRKRRDAKRLERWVISNPESGKRKRSRLERFVRFLGTDTEPFHHNAIELIYGKRIAMIDLNTEKCLIIENEALADFQKTIFKALYKKLK
ncbi:hypothetical protein HYT05_03920 [Candidatus Kaiserbacteria bacterium]|nr:hypothetical protein [Candidatus Kaiserbacteria bacterium]